MDKPLGNSVGNSLEVIEAINLLKGSYEQDFYNLCVALASEILRLAGMGDYNECEAKVKKAILDGSALQTFTNMVKAQGGDVSLISNVNNFKKSQYVYEVKAQTNGYISKVNAEDYGLCALTLGAGRNYIGEQIDYSAGIIINKKLGDFVNVGDTITTLYTNKIDVFEKAENLILNATKITDKKPNLIDVVIKKIY